MQLVLNENSVPGAEFVVPEDIKSIVNEPYGRHAHFDHPDLVEYYDEETIREQKVHIFMNNCFNDGGVDFFSVNFILQGIRIGSFTVQNHDTHWLLIHRRVDPFYRGLGLFSVAMDIIEEAVSDSGKDLKIDVSDSDIRVGKSFALGVQTTTVRALSSRGYEFVSEATKAAVEAAIGQNTWQSSDGIAVRDLGLKEDDCFLMQ